MVQGWDHATRRCTNSLSNSEFYGLQFFGVTGVSTYLAWVFSPSIFVYHHFGGEPGNSYICNCLFLCCLFISHISSLPSNYNIRKGFILGFRLKMWYMSSLMMQWNPGTPKIWCNAKPFSILTDAGKTPADRLTDIFPRGKSLKPLANLEDGLPIFVSATEFGQLEGGTKQPQGQLGPTITTRWVPY